MKKFLLHFKSLTIYEIVMTCVTSVAIGVAFSGWTFIYEIVKPILRLIGLNYLLSGFWIFTGVFLPQIIRKPGVALISSILVAFVEGILTHWGLISLLWGFVQGLAAEIVFAIFLYKRWNIFIIIIACLVSTTASYLLDYKFYELDQVDFKINLIQYLSYLISSVFLAGILSYQISRRLLKIGLLNQFLIGKNL